VLECGRKKRYLRETSPDFTQSTPRTNRRRASGERRGEEQRRRRGAVEGSGARRRRMALLQIRAVRSRMR
jgi:hypothetical protein